MITVSTLLSELDNHHYEYSAVRLSDKHYGSVCFIQQGQQVFSDETIYIIRASHLPNCYPLVAESGLFIIGDRGFDYAKLGADDILQFSGDTNTEALLSDCANFIQSEKFKLNAIHAITEAFIANKGIEHILEAASEFINNPIMLFSVSTDLIATSLRDVLIPYEDYALQNTLDKGYASYEVFRQYDIVQLLETIKKSVSPYVLSTGFATKMRRMFMRILVKNKMVAYLGVQEIVRPFERNDFSIIKSLSSILAIELERNPFQNALHDSAIENILTDLLENRFILTDVFEKRARSLNCKIKKYCYILTVTTESKSDIDERETLPNLQRYFRKHLLVKSVYYEGKVVFLIDLDSACIQQEIDKWILPFLSDYDLVGGLSHYFTKILDAAKYYGQSLQMLDIGLRLKHKSRLYSYNDYYTYNILTNLEKHQDIKSYCLPEIFELIQNDRKNHRDLLHTLSVYLENGKNAADTAAQLYIHINTLRYRLAKIFEIIKNDLENANDMMTFYISIKIIEMLNLMPEQCIAPMQYDEK